MATVEVVMQLLSPPDVSDERAVCPQCGQTTVVRAVWAMTLNDLPAGTLTADVCLSDGCDYVEGVK